jgi:hypothetical protein
VRLWMSGLVHQSTRRGRDASEWLNRVVLRYKILT